MSKYGLTNHFDQKRFRAVCPLFVFNEIIIAAKIQRRIRISRKQILKQISFVDDAFGVASYQHIVLRNGMPFFLWQLPQAEIWIVCIFLLIPVFYGIFKILLQIVYDVINDLVGGHDILQEVKKAVTGIVDAISSIF